MRPPDGAEVERELVAALALLPVGEAEDNTGANAAGISRVLMVLARMDTGTCRTCVVLNTVSDRFYDHGAVYLTIASDAKAAFAPFASSGGFGTVGDVVYVHTI